jgi:antitoxin MazE
MFRVTTALQKWGNSQGVRLPKELLKTAQFAEDELVELIADETGITIRKARKLETLDDLFRDYNGAYRCAEVDTGKPVGNEVW